MLFSYNTFLNMGYTITDLEKMPWSTIDAKTLMKVRNVLDGEVFHTKGDKKQRIITLTKIIDNALIQQLIKE